VKISPLDIQQQQFKGKMFGGLDPDDVDSFLQMVASEMEDLIRENTDIKDQLRRYSSEVETMKEREADLRETMLAAQKITEEMKANSQKEATLLIAEAEMNAEKILDNANRKLADLSSQIQELRREKVQFTTGFKALLDSHARMIALDDE
jgi:cell division initiation protein